MGTNELIGMIVVALISLGSFVALILKCLKPISDLNINIVKLTATIEMLIKNDEMHEARLSKQDITISKQNDEINNINITMNRYDERIKSLEERDD